MSEFTHFMENKIIDHILRNQSYTPPAKVYLALFTAAPDDDGGGTEVTGGSYARQEIALSAASGGLSSNSADITFPTATASWGTITHCAIMDALTSGNMLMYSPLDASKAIDTGDTFKVSTGDLDIAVD